MDKIQKTLIKAGRKDLAQKYYKKVRASSPDKEFKRQSGEIDKSIKTINSAWKKLKAKMQKQLKDQPTSWSGIGAGSELGSLVIKSNELANEFQF